MQCSLADDDNLLTMTKDLLLRTKYCILEIDKKNLSKNVVTFTNIFQEIYLY